MINITRVGAFEQFKESCPSGTQAMLSKIRYRQLKVLRERAEDYQSAHKSILAKGIQIIRKQRIFVIMFLDFFWSQKVPWVMFMASTNIAYQTN